MAALKNKIRRDDKVKIISGKDKGKIGKVLKVLNSKESVLVENINMVKHHTKPSAQNRQGGIIEREASLHWSNVMLMCSKCVAPARIKMQRLDDGSKVRVCGKCSEVIDA